MFNKGPEYKPAKRVSESGVLSALKREATDLAKLVSFLFIKGPKLSQSDEFIIKGSRSLNPLLKHIGGRFSRFATRAAIITAALPVVFPALAISVPVAAGVAAGGLITFSVTIGAGKKIISAISDQIGYFKHDRQVAARIKEQLKNNKDIAPQALSPKVTPSTSPTRAMDKRVNDVPPTQVVDGHTTDFNQTSEAKHANQNEAVDDLQEVKALLTAIEELERQSDMLKQRNQEIEAQHVKQMQQSAASIRNRQTFDKATGQVANVQDSFRDAGDDDLDKKIVKLEARLARAKKLTQIAQLERDAVEAEEKLTWNTRPAGTEFTQATVVEANDQGVPDALTANPHIKKHLNGSTHRQKSYDRIVL